MSPGGAAPVLYRVVYSELVRQTLLSLGDTAKQRGDLDKYVAALKDFQRILSRPQTGIGASLDRDDPTHNHALCRARRAQDRDRC